MTDLVAETQKPAGEAAQWRTLVDKVLKGADFDRVLTTRTFDGLKTTPLYPKAEGDVARALRAELAPWTVVQRLDHPDAREANALALDDLENGASGLVLSLEGAPAARGFGVKLGDEPFETLDRALAGVHLDLISLRLETAPFSGQIGREALLEVVARRGLDPASVTIDFGVDPLGDAVYAGFLPAPWAVLAERLASTAAALDSHGFRGSAITVDTRPHHEAGAAEAQELAAALSAGVAYLRALEAGGVPLEHARDSLSFLLVADVEEFLTVAKFRAFRRLWAQVERAAGLEPKPVRLLAETAWRSATKRDPWVNLLRGTIAAFSAAVGGADALTVLPYTAPLGLADNFGRRLARNTQSVLAEESNLWRVADPAAGAGGFETLTADLAATAWGLFREIEAEGGLPAALVSGSWQKRLAATRAERAAAVARRKVQITGTSEFPNLTETPVTVLAPLPAAQAVQKPAGAVTIEAFAFPRLAEPYEGLRDAMDAYVAAGHAVPKVFLAGLGSPGSFNGRVGFARAAFEAGGLPASGNETKSDIIGLVKAFRESGATAVCLCGSDETYAAPADGGEGGLSTAAAAAAAFAAAGAGLVALAGRPGDNEAAWRAAGVKEFLFAGDNLVAFLTRVHGVVGIAGATTL
ncbi:methylmalonyl-CoA mutase family protein [Pseudoxanthobacter sp.]|uniref:methylmalonyl-CoA mutase family protein n=1 Tax=Pseudoxanthobacter sp. TaxID=1925742 RepID=UPI002FDFC0F2